MAKKTSKKSIEHPEPGLRTAKQLYGTAFRCAKPGCREPLYRVNSDTDETILNSRIAHIHARSEGGPRWNAAMSPDENRGPDNLLLLCIPHAAEIDDMPVHFPAPMLQGWKQTQLAAYEHCQQGWDITDDQAEEVVAVSFALEQIVDAITRVLPFSPRQRPRGEALALADRRLRAGRTERLSSVASDRLDEVLQWMDGQSDPIVQVEPGRLRVLVAPMGAGKTEQASRWLQEGLQHAYDDDAVAVPVWLEAREAADGLEQAVRRRHGGDPKAICRIVVNDLDRVSPTEAARLLREAREMVMVWPNVAILATAQPGVDIDSATSIGIEPWTVETGAALMRAALGTVLPWRLWSPETTDLMRRPLTALALAARLASGGDVEVSRLQLFQDLPKTIIQRRRPDTASPQVWQALGRLAVLILQAHGPVPASAVGNEAQVWQLADTRLVVQHGDELSFALPIFEQYFGAEAIRSGAVGIDQAAGGASFPSWRYAIAFAIATCSDAEERERFMCQVARTNPAALSWTLDEIEPDAGHHGRAGVNPRGAPSIAGWMASPAGAGDGAQTDPALAAGLWLREAFEAVLEGYGPLAETLTPHRNGRLPHWGTHLNAGYMTVAEHWDLTEPAVVSLPDYTHLHDLRPGGWRSARTFLAPAGEYDRWRWARNRILEALARAVHRRSLATSTGSRITRERLWSLAGFAIGGDLALYGRAAVPLDAVRREVAKLMETVNTSVSATWQHGGYTVVSADVEWLNSQLALLDGDVLERPWPLPDLPAGVARWRWEGYSRQLAMTTTAEILAEAVAGYRDLVETNLPAFGPALGLYSILPVRIQGTVSFPFPAERSDTPTGLNFAWIPDASLDPAAPVPVELRAETGPERGPYWHTPTGSRPEPRAAFHLPMLEDGITPLGGARPSANLAYEWLARDLNALGWLNDAITFHD